MRKIRSFCALIFWILITLLFLDFSGSLHAWLGWMAKIQFLPAVLALNVGVVVFLVILTLLFGRLYCSVICPLGVFQDAVAWLGRRGKKLPYQYSPALSWLRYGVLALFIVVLVAGVGSLATLLAPYSAYGRMVSQLLQPLWIGINNLLALAAERMDSYAFYEQEVWLKSLPTLCVAVVTLLVVGVLAWRNGRTYCNTICPVGTVLGFISRFSLFRVTIDLDKCNHCGLCGRHCKASCINSKAQQIDYSRCVACFDCLDHCKHQALKYVPVWKSAKQASVAETPQATDTSRRRALSATVLVAASSLLHAQKKEIFVPKDGGLTPIKDREPWKRQTHLVPPGALGVRNMAQHCTACQLCVSVCPNQVLRPSDDLMRMMQPEMSYERGYCRPECTKCSEVCPAGAIRPITRADKTAIQIGHAVWVKDYCVPLTDGKECGNCARHCPSGAIQMVPSDPNRPDSVKVPVVNEERCIGCGACENLCPARPLSAIYVEGHEQHRNL
ncbi:MAG: 4Fe-4S dicluster domain-containing protein [Parabacteroides sp.]